MEFVEPDGVDLYDSDVAVVRLPQRRIPCIQGSAACIIRERREDLDDMAHDPYAVLEETDWASLTDAFGAADDTPVTLIGLLDDDPDTQAYSLGYLNGALHHQNSLYPATAPAACYVAAILDDARTATILSGSHGRVGFSLRVALLDWLGSIADEACDSADAIRLRAGFSLADYPPLAAVKALRPTLFQAVSTFFDDPDLAVQEAAIAAAVPLLDAPELAHHQTTLAPMVRGVLTASTNRTYRHIAIHSLSVWGEETESLTAEPRRTSHTDASRTGGRTTDPPF